MDSAPKQPKAGKVREADASRKCPYCRTPLVVGEATLTCISCNAVHHDECWEENGGCAVWGCDARPATEAETADPVGETRSPAGATAESRLPPVAAESGDVAPVGKVKGKGRGAAADGRPASAQEGAGATLAGQIRPVHLLVGLGILSVTLLAVIVVVFSGTDSGNSSTGSEQPTPAPLPDPPEPVPEATGFPAAPVESQRRAIERLIREWHVAADNGDRDTMWRLLSNRKKRQISEGRYGAPDSTGSYTNTGYEDRFGWEEGQTTFLDDLDASEARVSLVRPSYPEDRVRSIRVDGMTQRSTGCPWDGFTWVRFEGGQWLYEPGYLVTPERKRDWVDSSVREELLGEKCQVEK